MEATAEHLFRQYFEASPESMWVYDPVDLHFVTANPAACRQYGYSLKEFQHMTLLDVRPPEDVPQFKAHLARVETVTRPERTVWRHRTKEGEILHVNVLATPMQRDGRFLMLASLRNVTPDGVEMAQVLKSARCLLWEAEVSDNGDGTYHWVTEIRNEEAAIEFFPVETAADGRYSDAFYAAKLPEDSKTMDDRSTAALLDGKSGYQQEFRLRLANGEVRWLSEDVIVEKRNEGRWRLTGVCTDVTEAKRAREEISHVLTRARCILWQADVTDWGGGLHWQSEIRNSDAAQQLLNLALPSSGDYSHAFHMSKSLEDRERLDAHSTDAILSGSEGYQQEYRVRTATGETRWLFEDVSIEKRGAGCWHLTGVCTDVTERKKAELALADGEMRLRAIVESIDEIAFEFDAQGTYLNVWTANEKLLAKPRRDLLGAKAGDVLGRELARPFVEAFADVIQDRRPRTKEYALDLPDGKHWFLARISPILAADGSCTTVCMLARDITERKLAEVALQHSEARYQRMVANVPGVVAQLLVTPDRSYRCTYINAASREMFGLDPEEIQRDPSVILETVHPDARERFLKVFHAASDAMSPWIWEGRCLLRSGELKWIGVIARPELQEDADVLWDCLLMDITPRKEMEGLMRDSQNELASKIHDRTRDLRHANVALQSEIAERKQAQEELRESEARFRAIVEDQTEMICRFLEDGTLTFVNEAHCRYYKQRPEVLLGTSFISFLSAEDAQRVRAHMSELSPSNPVGSYEICSLSPDGQTRWQHWTDRYISDEAGEFVCFQAVGRDITEQKLAEEAMLHAKDESERANLAKSEFLSRMSHELRTPLNAILGFGQILERQNLTPLAKESVQHILKGGRHLLSLINEILDLSKVEAGKIETSIEPVSLADIVPASCDLVSSLRQEHQVSLYVDGAMLAPYHVLADQQRLKQVLINLLSNAIKYNRPGGSVTISCREVANERVRIEVTDTGSGIHPEDVPKLFIPFERLGAANSSIEGTGLGLALSQRLVVAMGGSLEVQSIPSVGSTFWIELSRATDPLEQADIGAIEARAEERSGTPHRQYSLLCIEDNLSNLRLVEVILASRPEIALHSALQGSIGLSLARQLRPDVVLLDLNLPDMSGRQVLEALRAAPETSELPVLVISADATEGQINRLLASGATAYLTKPLDVTQFLDTLEKVLEIDD